MDFLARRDHSEKELREKLMQRFEEAEVEKAIGEVRDRGWLLPPEELAAKVAESLHRKNKSYYYILHFLRKKGLPSVDRDSEREQEKALSILTSKAKDLGDRNHLLSLLKNRGFDTDTSRKALDEIQRS